MGRKKSLYIVKKSLYIVTSDFRGKLYLSFLIKDMSLLTFIIALVTC